MSDLGKPEWLYVMRQRLQSEVPAPKQLTCVGWDILELYNSGLTYRVVSEHVNPEPYDYQRYPIHKLGLKPKFFIVELPCIMTDLPVKGPFKGLEVVIQGIRTTTWYHLFQDNAWIGMHLGSKEEAYKISKGEEIKWTKKVYLR